MPKVAAAVNLLLTSAEIESYMKHLPSHDRATADSALGPLYMSEEPSKVSTQPEWLLPCHSIMLSSRSPVFAASTTHAQSTGCEKTADGKRIFRLPLHKRCAVRLLQFCYGTLEDPKQLSLLEAVQLAVISDMHDLKGQATGIACHEDGLMYIGSWRSFNQASGLPKTHTVLP